MQEKDPPKHNFDITDKMYDGNQYYGELLVEQLQQAYRDGTEIMAERVWLPNGFRKHHSKIN